jgi:phage terminase large subunit
MRKERWGVAVAHRRAGKTVACINDLLDGTLRCTKPDPRFAYIAPLYTQAKDVAWGYVKRYGLTIPGAKENESELRLDLPGGRRMRLYGADNYDRLRGGYLDGVILDEYADMDPRAWSEVIRPMLADRQGWALFIGTPKGKNAFWDVWDRAGTEPNWFRTMLKASETGLLPQEELDDARRVMTPEQYEQEFECSFDAAIIGAYYGKEMSAAAERITRVPHDPAVEVETWWDLGIGDSTAVWFVQRVNSEIRFIDYIEASGEGLPFYAKALRERPYLYSRHVLPHDVEVRELGTGKSRKEMLAGLGMQNIVVAPKLPIDDGIQAVRMLLPRAWFDAEKCKQGIEALKQYRRDWDDKLKVFRSHPLHNWASHGADAARTGAVVDPPPSTWAAPIKYRDTRAFV